MKKLLALILSVAGAAITLWAAYLLLSGAPDRMYGYDPVYGGLLGVAVLSTGLIMLSNG